MDITWEFYDEIQSKNWSSKKTETFFFFWRQALYASKQRDITFLIKYATPPSLRELVLKLCEPHIWIVRFLLLLFLTRKKRLSYIKDTDICSGLWNWRFHFLIYLKKPPHFPWFKGLLHPVALRHISLQVGLERIDKSQKWISGGIIYMGRGSTFCVCPEENTKGTLHKSLKHLLTN